MLPGIWYLLLFDLCMQVFYQGLVPMHKAELVHATPGEKTEMRQVK